MTDEKTNCQSAELSNDSSVNGVLGQPVKTVKITELETGKEFVFSGRVMIEQVSPLTDWAKPVFVNDIYSFNEDMSKSECKSFYLNYLMD